MTSPFSVPGAEHRQSIRAIVEEEIRARLGAERAISAAELAERVRTRLGLCDLADSTIERRAREAVADLCSSGDLQIASRGCGYFIPVDDDERRAGRTSLVRQIVALARRLRAYDRATAERLQVALQLGRGGTEGVPQGVAHRGATP